jgi:uncharacterized protein (DUF4415 family)
MSKIQTTLRLPTDLHRKFKLKCINQNKRMNDVLEEFVRKYVSEGSVKNVQR